MGKGDSMGGFIDALQGLVHKVVDVVFDDILNLPSIAEGINSIFDLGFSVVNLAFDSIAAGLRGDSFTRAVAKGLDDVATSLQNVYNEVLDDWLGIDDEGIFGIKTGFTAKIGQAIKDITHDHARSTVGIIAAVVAVVGMYYVGTFTFEAVAGILGGAAAAYVSTTVLVLSVLAVLGLGLVLSGILSAVLSAAVTVMSVPETLRYITNKLEKVEMLETQARLERFTDTVDGTVFGKMAGGVLYNEVYAGGSIYAYDQNNGLGTSVGEMFTISNGNKLINHIDGTQAGTSIFENRFDLQPIKTTVSGGGEGLSALQVVSIVKSRLYNAKAELYNEKVELYNAEVDKYNSIVSEYNNLPSAKKSLATYNTYVDRLKNQESVLSKMLSDLNDYTVLNEEERQDEELVDFMSTLNKISKVNDTFASVSAYTGKAEGYSSLWSQFEHEKSMVNGYTDTINREIDVYNEKKSVYDLGVKIALEPAKYFGASASAANQKVLSEFFSKLPQETALAISFSVGTIMGMVIPSSAQKAIVKHVLNPLGAELNTLANTITTMDTVRSNYIKKAEATAARMESYW